MNLPKKLTENFQECGIFIKNPGSPQLCNLCLINRENRAKINEIIAFIGFTESQKTNALSEEPPKEKECTCGGVVSTLTKGIWVCDNCGKPEAKSKPELKVEVERGNMFIRRDEKMIVLGVDGDRIFLATYYDDYEYRTAVIYSREELEQYGWKLANLR